MKNPTANIKPHDEKVRVFPLRLGTRQGCSLSPLPFQSTLEMLGKAIRQENEINSIQVGNKKVKLSLVFSDDMTLYIEYPKKSTHTHTQKKLFELTDKSARLQKYKRNIQNITVLLYTSNEQSEMKSRK